MKNRKWLKLIGIGSAFILFMNTGVLLMSFKKIWNFEGTSDGWLGYWGGIIGSLLGVIGALIVFNIQLKNEKKQRNEDDLINSLEQKGEKERLRVEKVDNTFFNSPIVKLS